MAEQIKDMQRQDPVAREQWYAYCEAYGENVRDPAKHDATFISNFIQQYNSGARLEYKEGVQLQQMIKMGQKKSQYWKAVWEQYCQTKLIDGKPAFDPAKHDSSFLEGFFDHIGKQAMGVGMMAGGKGDMSRMMGTGDPQKDQLVLKVKAFQKQGEQQKTAWHTFCDSNLGGVYDPTRHENSALQMFVNANGIQSIDTSNVSVQSANMQMRMGMAHMAFPQIDPAKMQLVQKIKTYQKLGEAQKNAWHTYCDSALNGKYDPARADIPALQQFCATYGC